MLCDSKKFIGAVEDEWQLFRYVPIYHTLKTMHIQPTILVIAHPIIPLDHP
jgi:hypothetical protein